VVLAKRGSSALWGRFPGQWLNTTYPGRWIGRGGPIAWPPRSPDVTPMVFFLWGHLKEQVYAVPPRTIQDLVARLQDVTTVVASMLRRVLENAVRLTAFCPEIFRTPIVTTMRPWFYHLIACAIWR
jgi:hypothetical protein